jgi:hypothetical protein
MQATIDFAGTPTPIDLDFENGTWQSGPELEEAEFPLFTEVSGKRYQVYSDGTFSEEELT